MITCKHATELISKSMEEELSVRERFSLRLHLFICEFCEQFRKQIEVPRRAVKREDSVCGEKLSEEAKHRILEKIQK